MGTDIEIHDDRDRMVVAEQSNSGNLLAQIVTASKDPAVNAEKMQAMANLAIQLQDREMQQEFNRDYNAAVMEMPVITKAGRIIIKDKNTQEIIQSTAFAKFEDLDRVVKPIARRHNIAYTFDVGGDDKRLLVSVTLRHTNGYVQRSEAMPLPLETSGSKNNVQGAGSTNTYGKRYVLCNAFAISTEGEDDDGNQGLLVSIPHERENTVLGEAEAAFAEGRYTEWYTSQSPRDRSWMVSSGNHARLGGQEALPAPKVEKDVLVKEKGGDPPPPDPDAEKRARWVENYIQKVKDTKSLDEFAILQEKQKGNLERIKVELKPSWERILIVHNEAIDRFSGKNVETSDEDLFGEDS